MPFPVRIPRINNNDDVVRISSVTVTAGVFVRMGDKLFEIESDKAVVEVEADQDGHVLALLAQEGEMVPVGAVVAWLGGRADEPVPAGSVAAALSARGTDTASLGAGPTTKAREMLRLYGLSAGEVPQAGERLTVADIEAYAKARGLAARGAKNPALAPAAARPPLPASATIRPASPARRGMIASVTWQRDHAAAAYLELPYDPTTWEAYAAEFSRAHRLLFSPLLSLMAYRLAVLAREMPDVNATVLEGPDGPAEVRYETVNLGFTVQAKDTLYLVVLEGAERLDEAGFVARLAELQRRAIARKLESAELRGATVGFTSMARWGVSRHVPVLAPYTSMMVAHTAGGLSGSRAGVLGVTYDHRVLSGHDAIRVLCALASPQT